MAIEHPPLSKFPSMIVPFRLHFVRGCSGILRKGGWLEIDMTWPGWVNLLICWPSHNQSWFYWFYSRFCSCFCMLLSIFVATSISLWTNVDPIWDTVSGLTNCSGCSLLTFCVDQWNNPSDFLILQPQESFSKESPFSGDMIPKSIWCSDPLKTFKNHPAVGDPHGNPHYDSQKIPGGSSSTQSLLEVLADTPALVESQGMSILSRTETTTVTSGIFKGIPEFKTYPPYRFSSQNLPETNHVFSSFKSERNLNGIMKLPIKMWSLSSNIFKYWIPGKKKLEAPNMGDHLQISGFLPGISSVSSRNGDPSRSSLNSWSSRNSNFLPSYKKWWFSIDI